MVMGERMTKNQLIEKVARDTGHTVKTSKEVINAFIEEVESGIKKGDSIGLIGFGVFDTIKRKARTAQNPKTGEKVKVPAKTTVRFRAGSNLQTL